MATPNLRDTPREGPVVAERERCTPPAAVGERDRLVLRSYAWFYLAAPAVALGGLVLPLSPDVSVAGLVALVATTFLIGLAALAGWLDRWSAGAPRVLTTLSVLAVTAGLHFAGQLPSGYELFYLWALAPGFLHLPRRAMAWQLGAVAAGYGTMLFLDHQAAGHYRTVSELAAPWFVLVATLAGVGLLVERIVAAQRDSEKRFRRGFDDAAVGMVFVGLDGRIIEANNAAAALWGRSRAELSGRAVGSITHPDDLGITRQAMEGGLASGLPISFLKRYVRPDGSVVSATVTSSVVCHPDGSPSMFFTQVQDVTARLRAEAVAERRRVRQGALVSFTQQALATGRLEDLYDQAARVVAEVVAVPFSGVLELQGDTLHYVASVGFDEEQVGRSVIPAHAEALARVTLRSDGPVAVEDIRRRPDLARAAILAQHQIASSLGVALRRSGGQATGVLFLMSTEVRTFDEDDRQFLQAMGLALALAQERQCSHQELLHQASHDGLTGLPNRLGLGEALRPTTGADEGGAALLLLDVDAFKDVNDGFGHAVGDQVIIEVGRRLASVLRPGSVLARLGGDAFAVAVPGLVSPDAARAVATRLLGSLDSPVVAGAATVQVSASVGIALPGLDRSDLATLHREADIAMYQAKKRGGGWALYSADEAAGTGARLALGVGLRQAIDADQVQLAYQPLLDLATGTVLGAEALARWSHPTLGPVPPDVFIPIAEQSGLIRPLTRALIGKAVAQVAQWRSEGIELTVAVNLSLRALHDPELLACVQSALLSNAVPAAALTLELTESAFAHPDALDRLQDLRDLGLHLSIDDFGTGYSSLSYLKRLPVSELKIDRSLVGDIVTDHRDREIVGAVVAMAHSLGLRVVVEGIETSDVAALVAELGCDIGQGYWISRPVPPADLTGWLLARTEALT